MSIENVKKYFKQYDLEDRIITHDHIGDTVEHAAEVLQCKPEEIVKSMTFNVNDHPILIAMAGDTRIDNKKFKSYFDTKAKMIPFSEVNDKIGHEPGAVTPFAVNNDVSVYLDDSLKRFKIVYTAGGSLNSTIKLTLQELITYSDPVGWVNIGKEQ